MRYLLFSLKIMNKKVIVWFRQDLRLYDNPALSYALEQGSILPIYILDTDNIQNIGEASKVWLHHSLDALNNSLSNKLNYFIGNPQQILLELTKKHNIQEVVWNRCYEPKYIKRDSEIKSELQTQAINVHSFNSALLWEPWEVLKSDKTPYKIFTPFYQKGCLNAKLPRYPLNKPNLGNILNNISNILLEELELLPKINWQQKMLTSWAISEQGAQELLQKLIDYKVNNYHIARDYPNIDGTSRLSPYLHFGQISPNQIYYTIKQLSENLGTDCYIKELIWREFAYNLLYHNPTIQTKNLNHKFDRFSWQDNKELLVKWQQGQTGIPIIDAGMRELWQTGYMHNRIRMLVSSFLVKNLLIHWHHGEQWFFNTLFDADLASNSASWQWVAGCGTDAAPYFRIFNPVTQSEKFDAEGMYIRKYIPELNNLPNKYLFSPWTAPKEILNKCNIILGIDYPHPVIDLSESRQVALKMFETLKTV